MKFADASSINWLWLILFVGIFLLWRYFQRRKICELFIDKKLFSHVSKNLNYKKDIACIILLFCVGLFSIIALMRPQWGFEWREVKREGLDILIAIDTSKSMLTDDVKPNRLERSKLAVKDLVKKLNGDRIGLIAFSGTGFLVTPLTVDYSGFNITLDEINTGTIPRGGTSISSAINEAVRSYKDVAGKFKALVIITDGEDLEGMLNQSIELAKENAIKIFTIGIGTKEGELIRYKDQYGEYNFVKDRNGDYIKSRLNEDILQNIALSTGGIYVHASGAEFGLDLIYEQKLSKMDKTESKSKMERRYHERYQYPLTFAFIFLMFGTCLNIRKT